MGLFQGFREAATPPRPTLASLTGRHVLLEMDRGNDIGVLEAVQPLEKPIEDALVPFRCIIRPATEKEVKNLNLLNQNHSPR